VCDALAIDREARHHCPLAPRWVQIVLALEVVTL
jgi:hypothetical protein